MIQGSIHQEDIVIKYIYIYTYQQSSQIYEANIERTEERNRQ